MILEQRTTRLRRSASPRRENDQATPERFAQARERRTGGLPAASSDAPRASRASSVPGSDIPTLHAPRSTLNAFTLIEVLVAMTVLSVMVLMVANIFQSSSAAWNIGTQKADMNTAARAALDYMARELASAVAGPIDKAGSGGADYLTFKWVSLRELRFLALSHDPDAANGIQRAVRGVSFYWVPAKFTLMTGRKVETQPGPEQLDCYINTPPSWDTTPGGANMLISNVWDLKFFVYTNESTLATGQYINEPLVIILNTLPLCVDIALEMLGDDDMARALTLTPGAPQNEYVARNSKLYSTRVYFPNRKGYQAR